ncbi:glycoside hydrolase family 28 protein [Terriglobus sp. TAA 43]|uniref:rhamnogalacturonidase n=1 Tax=Terriglobus sp. TAA 43 TaxID=278961 RepID=UPI00064707B7|nr:glycoside hydrolase family 28 protein [Terriglobus sp. TAA 43]
MNSARRDLLKFSPLALAAFVPSVGSAQVTGASTPSTPTVFDVRNYGASGTGKQLDTNGINAAIEAATKAGGGTVVFPAGTYLTFSIRLKSNIHLYLSQGAVILAAESPKPGETTGQMGGVYDAAEPQNPAIEPFQDFGHNHWHNSLIWGEGIENVSITGPGLIYGKGLSFGATRAARGDYPIYKAEQAGVGNKAIAMKNCRNVTFREFRLLKGGHFGFLLTGVDNLVIDGLLIDTDRDGIDIDCCKNVHVSNCTVNSPWDDGICPKSSYALGYARATENVTITGCTVTGDYMLGTVLDGTYKHFPADAPQTYRTGRIKCGTESNGGFKNITISNCVFDGCHSLCLESEDGALCEDIAISNITMRDLFAGPLFFRLGARLRGPKPETKPGTLQRIVVNNITSYNSTSNLCNILSGIPDFPIRDVKISNFYMQHRGGATADKAKLVPPEEIAKYPDPEMFGPMPAQGFFLRHVRNVEVSHVEIAPAQSDARPSFVLEDVDRADFFAITAPTTPSAFDFRHAKDVRVGWSRAAKDAVFADASGKTL